MSVLHFHEGTHPHRADGDLGRGHQENEVAASTLEQATDVQRKPEKLEALRKTFNFEIMILELVRGNSNS